MRNMPFISGLSTFESSAWARESRVIASSAGPVELVNLEQGVPDGAITVGNHANPRLFELGYLEVRRHLATAAFPSFAEAHANARPRFAFEIDPNNIGHPVRQIRPDL